MKTLTLSILGGVTLAAVAAAIFVSQRGPGAAEPRPASAKLYPELGARINDVARIEISSRGTREPIVLERNGDVWGAAAKFGYPVDMAKIRPIVVGIAEFTVVGEMTKNPASYAKLGVEDIPEPGAVAEVEEAAAEEPDPMDAATEAKRVRLADKNGAVLADVLIGKARVRQGYGGTPSLYVRPAGQAQALEVTGTMNVATDIESWLVREIAKIDSPRMARIVFTHPDGDTLSVSKAAPADKDFAIADMPAGAELAWPGVANGLSNALQWLSLEDVQRAEGFDLAGATTAEFTTFDGMVVTAKTLEKDGKTWLALSAAFDEARRYQAPVTVVPPPEGDAAAEEATPAEPDLKAIDDVKKEVEAFNAKVGPWLYSIPGYGATSFRKRMTDLLKKPSDMQPAEDAGAFDLNDFGEPIPAEGSDTPPAPPPEVPPQPPIEPPTPPADGGDGGDGR